MGHWNGCRQQSSELFPAVGYRLGVLLQLSICKNGGIIARGKAIDHITSNRIISLFGSRDMARHCFIYTVLYRYNENCNTSLSHEAAEFGISVRMKVISKYEQCLDDNTASSA